MWKVLGSYRDNQYRDLELLLFQTVKKKNNRIGAGTWVLAQKCIFSIRDLEINITASFISTYTFYKLSFVMSHSLYDQTGILRLGHVRNSDFLQSTLTFEMARTNI